MSFKAPLFLIALVFFVFEGSHLTDVIDICHSSQSLKTCVAINPATLPVPDGFQGQAALQL